jgi:NADH dehydrogenase FAD-containing subunit
LIQNGSRTFKDSKIALSILKSRGISFLQDEIISINPLEKITMTVNQNHGFEYDYLVIALGAEYAPGEIDGFV